MSTLAEQMAEIKSELETVPEEETTQEAVLSDEEVPEESVEDTGDSEEDELYITDLAAELGVDVAELYNLKMKTADGAVISLGEFKDLKQGTSDEASAKALAEEKQKIEQYKQQVIEQARQEREQILQQAKGIAAVPEKVQELRSELISLTQRYQSVNWEEVEKQDPGQAALLKQKFSEMYTQTQGELTKAEGEAQQQQQQSQQQMLYAANAEFEKRVPEWRDETTRNRESELIKSVVHDYGFTDQEIGQTVDPRLRHLLRDYAVMKDKLDSADANAKKVVKRGNSVLREAARAAKLKKGNPNELDKLTAAGKKAVYTADKVAAIRKLFETGA